MKTRVPILVMMVLLALALFAPAALAQDDDDDDVAELPSTGGPALIAPLAGALLLGSGIVAGFVGLRPNP